MKAFKFLDEIKEYELFNKFAEHYETKEMDMQLYIKLLMGERVDTDMTWLRLYGFAWISMYVIERNLKIIYTKRGSRIKPILFEDGRIRNTKKAKAVHEIKTSWDWE